MRPKIDVPSICSLAHIKLTKKEKIRLIPQLIKIAEWVNKIDELDVEVSENEVYSPVSFPLRFRIDRILESLTAEKALDNSPEKEKGFIKVPKVIKEK